MVDRICRLKFAWTGGPYGEQIWDTLILTNSPDVDGGQARQADAGCRGPPPSKKGRAIFRARMAYGWKISKGRGTSNSRDRSAGGWKDRCKGICIGVSIPTARSRYPPRTHRHFLMATAPLPIPGYHLQPPPTPGTPDQPRPAPANPYRSVDIPQEPNDQPEEGRTGGTIPGHHHTGWSRVPLTRRVDDPLIVC
jgi:hypothetical protein